MWHGLAAQSGLPPPPAPPVPPLWPASVLTEPPLPPISAPPVPKLPPEPPSPEVPVPPVSPPPLVVSPDVPPLPLVVSPPVVALVDPVCPPPVPVLPLSLALHADPVAMDRTAMHKSATSLRMMWPFVCGALVRLGSRISPADRGHGGRIVPRASATSRLL